MSILFKSLMASGLLATIAFTSNALAEPDHHDHDHGHKEAKPKVSQPAKNSHTGHDVAEQEHGEHAGHDEHKKSGDVEKQGHDDHAGHDEHEEEGHIDVSAERAARAGIEVEAVGSAIVTESLLLFGRTEPDPQQVSHVRARYPGLIRSVKPGLGDSVAAGQTIASVESNDSLQRYSIRAPIGGVVVQRHANAGEFAGEEPLLTIADYSRLWVALTVFPKEAERIRVGQVVRLRAGERQAVSDIRFINPGTGERPSIVAHARLDNGAGDWSPGLLIEGEVIIAEQQMPLAIDNRALQTVEGQQVVFVQTDDGFEVTPVELGRRDARRSEVLAGLSQGQRIAVKNSYLLKAELEKSGASHDH